MAVRRSLAWITLSQGSFLALQFATSVALARLLSPFEMGVYSIGAATIGLLNVFSAFGLALFIIREHDLTDAVLATAFTFNALLNLLLGGSILLLSIAGNALFHAPGVQNVMMLLAAVPVISIAEFLPAARLEREARFGIIALVNAARALLTAVVTVSLALAGMSSMSLAWGAVAGAATGAILLTMLGWHHVSFQLGAADWRRILRFGFQQLVIQGVNNMAARLSEIALGRLLGLDALGLYGRASNLNNLFYNNVNLIVGRITMVEFAAQHRAGTSLRDTYLRTLELLTGLLWPCFAGLAILGGPFIEHVYGTAWLGAAVPLSALAIAAMLLVSITMTWEVFAVCHETARQARFEFMRTGAGLLLFAGGCWISVSAAAASRIAEALLSVLLYRPHLERMTQTRWADFLAIYRRSGWLTAAACGPALVTMIVGGWSPDVPLPHLAAAIGIGALCWIVSLWALDHPLMQEVRQALASMRPVRHAPKVAG